MDTKFTARKHENMSTRVYRLYSYHVIKVVIINYSIFTLTGLSGTFNMSNITPTNRSAVMGDEQCAKEVGDKIELSRLKLVSEKLRSKVPKLNRLLNVFNLVS